MPTFELSKTFLPDTPGTFVYILAMAFIFGACMGSFLNCAAWRICHNESVLKGHSHCAVCNHVLGLWDLIPIFSFLMLKGRCRYCGEKMAVRYVIAEILSGLVFVSIVCVFGLTWDTVKWIALSSILLCISFADLEDYLIPDRLIIAGIVLRLPFAFFLPKEPTVGWELLNALIGGLAVAIPLLIFVIVADKVLGKETMGGGDIKLIFMIGLYFNWKVSLLIMIMACFLGIIFAVIGKAIANKNRSFEETEKETSSEEENKEPLGLSDAEILRKGGLIPFGPSIAAGAWICLFFGQQIVTWYAGLFSLN